MSEVRPTGKRPVRVGFRTSMITVFMAVVLLVGLTLVYLSFERVSDITRTAAGTFIDKVAQIGADRIDSQFRDVRDCLEIIGGLPSVQSADIANNPRLYHLMAAMLRNDELLFNLYVGYDDGSFVEMDVIDRAGPPFRSRLNVPEDAVFRLVVISRASMSPQVNTMTFLSDNLTSVAERPGPADYDPRKRPWYVDAFKSEGTLLSGPYVFFATGQPGYTLRMPLKKGRRGVVAGDILLSRTEALLDQQRLGRSGMAFLFNGDGRIVAHPQMSELTQEFRGRSDELPTIDVIKLTGLSALMQSSKKDRHARQFLKDHAGRTYVAAFHKIDTAGTANIRLAAIAPLDEFYSEIIAERRALFLTALGFVAAMLPLAFWLGSLLARTLRELAKQTDELQRFQLVDRPRIRSLIGEIDELGRSVFTTRTVIRNFSNFIPRQLVRQLIESGAALGLGGTRREITVLFTDVADFTAKTEKADPSQVMIYTSRYFAALSETIMRHHGTIDKFIGDAVMAFWNAPADDPEHAVNACRAVLACLRRNDDLNAAFEAERWPAYTTRFGLHSGDAVVGNIGSSDRMNYTALGATINLASRLEGLNKGYRTRILVSAAVKARADRQFVFRSVDRIKPKGFAEAVRIFELRCEQKAYIASELAFCERWEKVYAMIEHADRAKALSAISVFLAEYPGDGVAQFHSERLRAAGEAPAMASVAAASGAR